MAQWGYSWRPLMPPLNWSERRVNTAVKVTSEPVPAVVGRQITGRPDWVTLSRPT